MRAVVSSDGRSAASPARACVRLPDLIAEAAARRGEAPALTVKQTTITYAQLHEAVETFAAGLARDGLRRGERVAVWLEKRVETVVAIFGAAAADGVFVPVNPLLRPSQVRHILTDCDVRVLVTSADRLDLLSAELAGCPSLERVIVVGEAAADAGLAASDGPVVQPWPAAHGDAVATSRRQAIDADVAAIFYTSGSTGKPKGVVLSHRNLLAGAQSVAQYLGNGPDDCILAVLPLSFDAGFSQLTTGFCAGAHVVLLDYLLPRDVVRTCARHGVTGLTCVPPLWHQLAEQEWPEEASRSLRYFANTGGRMPRPTLDRLRSHFPQAAPYLMYGLTEAFRSTYLDPAEIDRRPDSIGKAIPNAEVLVVREDGSECAPGEEGELVHRGALVALGYWNDPERTAERFKPAPGRPEGLPTPELAVWSGDMVVRDEEGFLYFVGRRDEMIKTSGYRVSPTELEEAAHASGLVAEVAALGVEDLRLGHRIVLVASAPDGGELDVAGLRAHLRRTLPRYMVPGEIVARPALPRSPNGKLDRALLKREAAGS